MTIKYQGLLFNLQIGEFLKDFGIGEVIKNNLQFISYARNIATIVVLVNGTVTCDDVRMVTEYFKIKPHHRNVWGGIFRESRWKCVGRKKSALITNHAREIRIWSLRD